MKTLSIVVLLAVLIGGGYWWYQNARVEPPPTMEFSWELEDLGENPESFAPETKVALRGGESVYVIGTYTGTCLPVDETSWTQDENEVAALICWWAGGGKEIGVFVEKGKYVVKEGDLDEGSAETPAFRGNFKTLLEI